MDTQQRIIEFVTYTNWFLLVAATILGLANFSLHVGVGIFAGGLVVTINFHLLAKTLRRSFAPPHIASVKAVLFKYYIRFIITAIIIYFLMATPQVDPIGLIAGLSIVVASMMCATLNELRLFIMKEAG